MIAQLQTSATPSKSAPTLSMSPQDYLSWELKQPIKYGYMGGRAYAMSGGTIPHNQVAVNLVSLLNTHLRGSGCKTLSSDAKVGLTESGPYHYPDVSVTCDERDKSARSHIQHPCLVVEVLSDSTEAFDRGKKFRDYRRIKTLQEYVLIDPDAMSVECYRLNSRGKWELTHYVGSDDVGSDDVGSDEDGTSVEVELASVKLSFPIEALCENISLPAGKEETDELVNTDIA